MMRPEPWRPDLLEAALDLVHRRTGLVFLASRRAAFESALGACMRRAGVGHLETYLARLGETPSLFDELAADVTVGETYFLRDAGQWDLIRTRLLPALLDRHPSRPLRIWSAGCASGEEPYSAAIVLHQLGAADRAQVLGTDLSRPALARARRGEYPAWSLRNVPPDVERTYFRRRGQRFDLLSSIRRKVEFRPHNLVQDQRADSGYDVGPMDLILCRNVLIYFDASTAARVGASLLSSLTDGGYLILGASDPLIGSLTACEVEVTEVGLLYRKAGNRPHLIVPPLPRPGRADPGSVPGETLVPAVVPVVAEPVVSVTAPEDRLLAAQRAYADRDYVAAAAQARTMVEDGEGGAIASVLLVRSLANRGELAEAGRACAAALDRHRTEAELVYLHAILLGQSGLQAESAEALRRALYLDRGLVVAHLALGDVLARLGNLVGARRAFRAAERLLSALPAEDPVPASDGEPAVRLTEVARSRLRLLDETAA